MALKKEITIAENVKRLKSKIDDMNEAEINRLRMGR
jgi:hypothetical protein